MDVGGGFFVSGLCFALRGVIFIRRGAGLGGVKKYEESFGFGV